VYYAIPLFVACILLELGYARLRGRSLYDRRDTAACIAMGLGNLAVAAAFKTAALGVFWWVWQYRLFDVPAGAWWAWALLIIGDDLCYYWYHRAHHEVRCLWAAHVNHHSSQRYNLSVALRQSWTAPITGFWFWLPLALIGFHPLMILTAHGISLLYQFWLHTETIRSLGPLEWILNTPSHHRVHHGSNPHYLDRNYAGIFIVWDRLFGTFEAEGEPARYGLVRNIHTFNPVTIAFHEWLALYRDVGMARGWRRRIELLFSAPAPALNPLDGEFTQEDGPAPRFVASSTASSPGPSGT
jgi:sterol desaturase/sphingolipid hydroxylase (fatty acid hydroxylase superfamily)